jgi:transposase-like protein
MYTLTPPETKAAILKDIQHNGMTVADAARKHKVNYKTVHNWIKTKSTGSSVSWPEYNKVKRENAQLKTIIGELALNLSKSKKM